MQVLKVYPDTYYLYVDAIIEIWDLNSNSRMLTLSDLVGAITKISFHNGNSYLFWIGYNSGYSGTESEVWDISDSTIPQKLFHVFDLTADYDLSSYEFRPISIHSQDLENSILVVGGLAEYRDFDEYYGYDLQIWDTVTKQLLWSTRLKDSNEVRAGELGTTLDLSPDSKLIAVGLSNGDVQLWDMETEKLRTEIQSQKVSVSQVLFSPDGDFIAVDGFDTEDNHIIRILDVTNPNDVTIVNEID